MRYSSAFVLLGLLSVALPAEAQNIANPAEWTSEFLDELNRAPDTALLRFKTETYLGKTVGAATEQFRDAYTKNRNSFGAPLSNEIVLEQRLGQRFMRISAAINHSLSFQLVIFDFYKPASAESWNLNAFRIETNAQNLPWASSATANPR